MLFIGGIATVLFLLTFMCGYFKIPTNQAGIVSGLSKTPKIIIGKAGFKFPFLERLDKLYLGHCSVDVKTQDFVPTNEFINVKLDAFATVKVKNDEESLKKACVHFLNMGEDGIIQTAQQVLEGSLRDITGSMSLKEMVNNRQAFADKVQETAKKDLEEMGLEIVSFNIQNIFDEGGVIDNLGIDNVVAISKTAQIAKAEAERDVKIAQAQANKEANDAQMNSEKAIAEKQTEIDIRKAELKQQADIKKAQANSAYDIQKQVQQKELNARAVEAEISMKEKEVVLQEQTAKVTEKTLDAQVRRQADAEKYRQEKEAEARLFISKQEAEATKFKAEKDAEAIRIKGNAEAEAIRAKGLAEAEALEKKAEAMQKFGKAAMAEMMVKVLPDIAEKIAYPLGNIQEIKVYGTGGNNTVDAIGGNVPVMMGKVFDTVKDATGVDLKAIMDADTIDAKVNKNVAITGGVPVEVSNS